MSGTIAQLKEIKELLDGGVLTQQEFDAQKTLILEKPKITQVAPAPVAPAPVAPVVGQPAMMQAGMMQPGMMQPGMQPNKPANVPLGARGPITETYHGPNTDAFCCIMFLIGCPCIWCPLAARCGPGMDERDVWIGPNGEKYKHPTGELIPNDGRGGTPKPGQIASVAPA